MSKKDRKSLNLPLLARLLKYTIPYRGIFYGIILANIVLMALAILRPWLMKITVDDYILDKNLSGLVDFSLLIVGILILEVIGNFTTLFFSNDLGQSIIRDIRKKLFHKIVGLRTSFFDKSSVGTIVTRTVSDMERVSEVFSNGFFEIVSDVLKMLAVTAVMLYTDWRLSLIVFMMLPLLLYATKLFQKAMKVAFSEVRLQVSNLNSFVQERISGMKIVQLFHREDIEYEQFKKINKKHQDAWLKTVWYNSIFFPIAELSTSVAIGLVVWYGSVGMTYGHTLKIGTIFMFIQLLQMLFRPLRQIADKFNNLQMGIIASNRVFDLLDTSDRVEDTGTLEAPRFRGNISFDHVLFQYVDNQVVIKDMSFSVQAGQTIAIVGPTGSGKSTISNLINRFYDIQGGKITIDGTDIRNYTLNSLRSQISIVLQDVFLFADTIMNNISLQNSKINEDDVIKASKEIGLYNFIMSLPGGFSYNVKERGNMLSSGQKQLIAFLRAYVNKPSILILDEATSSVDNHSENLIREATEKITQGRTSIIIAHRLATIKNASKILVIDNGIIIESGTHQELLKNPNGHYKELYEIQFRKTNSYF